MRFVVVLCRMGRVKLKIKRLENTNGRQATYAKRKHGIMKKANELSILCDIDIVLLMFSPSGKPSICRGLRRYLCSYFHFFTYYRISWWPCLRLGFLGCLFKRLDSTIQLIKSVNYPNLVKISCLTRKRRRIHWFTIID